MKVFVDNDVILDVLLERSQYLYSSKILEYIEKKKVTGFTSPIIFTNTFFLVTKKGFIFTCAFLHVIENESSTQFVPFLTILFRN